MLVTVATEDGKSSQMELTAETLVSTMKSLAASELSMGSGERLIIMFNGRPLADTVTLGNAGVSDQDLLLITTPTGAAAAAVVAPSSGPSLSDIKSWEPNGLLEFFKENPQLLRQMHHVNAQLAEAVETGDVGKVRTCVMIQQMDSHKAKWTQETERAALFANPDSEENQAKIAKMIEQDAIDQNYAMAMEEAPEVFARVSMLYIDTEINSVRVKAFVDSGAQSTIMSATCAEKCGLMRLVDRRFHGEARGVGTGKILGRIHMAQIKIGAHYFPCSFTILETSDVDFLFGLDMLKRHLCVIDLKSNHVALGSAGTTVPFLSEKDLPASMRETKMEDLNRKRSAEDTTPAAAGGATSASTIGAPSSEVASADVASSQAPTAVAKSVPPS